MKIWFQDLTTEEAKEERMHLWVWFARVVLLLAVLFIAVAWVTNAHAKDTMSATNEDGKLTLRKGPCKLKPWFKDWREAHWLYKGKPYEACWRLQPTRSGVDMVVVLDSSGVVTPVDVRIFTPDEAI